MASSSPQLDELAGAPSHWLPGAGTHFWGGKEEGRIGKERGRGRGGRRSFRHFLVFSLGMDFCAFPIEMTGREGLVCTTDCLLFSSSLPLLQRSPSPRRSRASKGKSSREEPRKRPTGTCPAATDQIPSPALTASGVGPALLSWKWTTSHSSLRWFQAFSPCKPPSMLLLFRILVLTAHPHPRRLPAMAHLM